MLDKLQFGKFVCQVDHSYSQVLNSIEWIRILSISTIHLVIHCYLIVLLPPERRMSVQIPKLGFPPTDLISKAFLKLRVGSLLSLINGQEYRVVLERIMVKNAGSTGMFKLMNV